MSLADELLADLGSDDDEQIQPVTESKEDVDMDIQDHSDQNGSHIDSHLSALMSSSTQDITAEDLTNELKLENVDIPLMSKLMSSLEPILSQINQVDTAMSERMTRESNLQDNATYQLIVKANSYSVEIDNEIFILHKVVKEKYSKRFDELGSLVPNPVDYAKCVKAIGNDIKELTSNEDLAKILPKATSMVVSMAAFESHGTELSPSKLNQIFQGCDLIIRLDDSKRLITEFVSSQLSYFAPNVAAVVDSHTAAQLMGFAGGLQGLAKTPSANIPSIGANRQVAIGFGYVGRRRQGFLYHSELIRSVPSDKRVQAMRIASGRLVLAARVDLMHGSRDGSQGRAWRSEISTRIEKLLEPPINKTTRALPVPKETVGKRRGGRRIRKFKEQFQQTELQKAANRMAFGKEEPEIMAYDESVGSGMAGSNSGNIRNTRIDKRTKAKMSKGLTSRVQQLNRTAQEAVSDGLQSSLNFTPGQGIQLVDPSRSTKPTDDRGKWFSSGTFTQLNTQKPSAGEFTIPSKRKNVETNGTESKRTKQ